MAKSQNYTKRSCNRPPGRQPAKRTGGQPKPTTYKPKGR